MRGLAVANRFLNIEPPKMPSVDIEYRLGKPLSSTPGHEFGTPGSQSLRPMHSGPSSPLTQ